MRTRASSRASCRISSTSFSGSALRRHRTWFSAASSSPTICATSGRLRCPRGKTHRPAACRASSAWRNPSSCSRCSTTRRIPPRPHRRAKRRANGSARSSRRRSARRCRIGRLRFICKGPSRFANPRGRCGGRSPSSSPPRSARSRAAAGWWSPMRAASSRSRSRRRISFPTSRTS